jgi:hypothetical protein
VNSFNNAPLSLNLKQHRSYHIIFVCVSWGVLWVLTYYFSDAVLKAKGIDYLRNSFLLSAFFIFNAIFITTILKTRKHVVEIYRESFPYFILLIILFVVFTVVIGLIFPVTNAKLVDINKSGFLFPHFNFYTTQSKLVDILFQQILISSLLVHLKNYFNNNRIILIFGVCFFLIHTPLIITMKYTALLFIIPSIIAGFIFSYLMLYYKNGALYSLATHMLFYIILGCILRYYT